MEATPSLLERESELASLAGVVETAGGGEGRCVLIEGPAGIGKSSLLRAVRGRAAAAGMRVLTARGSELEQTLPYGVVRQLFERVVARAGPSERDELLGGAAALAGPVLGAAGQPPAADEESAFAVQHGLYWLAANLIEHEPLLLAVDDLHWADVSSRRWLAYLAHRLEGLAVAVVATLRPVAGEADAALADLLADPGTLIIRPAPLSPKGATSILAERVAVDSLEELSSAAHQATAGNPLLLHELAGALAQTDSHDLVADVRRLAPEVVARRVRLQLSKLGPQAAAMARAVAVLGDDADCSSCIPELAGLESERAAWVAARLAGAELLRPGPSLRFVHPLVRSAVYDAMSETERGAAHAAAAAMLAERGASRDRVAAQIMLAPPAGDPGRVERLRQAASEASAAGAAESARTYLQRALEEPATEDRRGNVLLELAAAEGLLGVPAAVDHLREALALTPEPARRAEIRQELARGLIWRSQERQAVAEMEMAGAEAPPDDAPLRRRLDADYFSAALRVPELHKDALARLRGRRVDSDDEGGLMLLALKAYAAMLEGERREEAISLAERALARGLPREHAPSWSLWGAVSALLHADQHETSLRAVDEAIANARRRGAAYLFSGASMVRASILYMAGNLIEAEADARAAVDALPDRRAMIMPLAFGVLADVLIERGELDQAAATLAAAGADGALPESFGSFPLLSARAMLRFARGDFRAAAVDALASGRALDAVGFRNPSVARWRGQAALALLGAGDAAEARRLAGEQLVLARGWGSARAVGCALRAFGLTKGGSAGLPLLRESCAVLDSSPAMLERARSYVELGSALRRAGQRVEARTVLRSGGDLAPRCGAMLLARRAHEELLAAGAKPRSTALSGVESLTPSERRIAAMAAEGMGNREIAQALFVTLRTVEMHLSNAFRKLAISSRTQLVDALAEQRPPAVVAG